MSQTILNTEMENRTTDKILPPPSFTGKERDEETGYSYFSARYLDHDILTSFLSVDRYADKYPFISPYAYCAWNPIRLIDPSGDTISYRLGDVEYHYTQAGNGYAWQDRHGNTYSGDDKHLGMVTQALQKLQEKPVGEKLVGDLVAGEKTVQIGMGAANGADAICGEWVTWNPYKTTGSLLNEDGTQSTPSFIGLGHELAHINDTWYGTNDQTPWFTIPVGRKEVVPMCEKHVCSIENQLRNEHGLPLRKFYFHYVDSRNHVTYNYGLITGGM